MTDIYALINDPDAKAALRAVSAERERRLADKPFEAFAELLANLPERKPQRLDLSGPTAVIGEDLPADDPFRMQVETASKAVMPWKKGPFRLFGLEIDAEWRGDFKWSRLVGHLPPQRDKVVLDLGCNNGYFLFRLMDQEPRFALGVDPAARPQRQFQLLQRLARLPNLEFQMWGWQELVHLRELFDTVFCMGIVYHHFNPIQILRNIHHALKPGGLLVLESIVIPGDEPRCLFPADRYANMRNVWFTPTTTALRAFLHRTKFTDVVTVAVNKHEPDEQRTTAWNPGPSYVDFLDAANPDRTIEGHPAPWRAIVMARKPARGHAAGRAARKPLRPGGDSC